MKKTYIGLALILLLSVTVSQPSLAVIDSGRQYSSTGSTNGMDEFATQLSYLYIMYLLPQSELSSIERLKFGSGMKSLYRQFKSKRRASLTPEIILNSFTACMSANADEVKTPAAKKVKHKRVFKSITKLLKKPATKDGRSYKHEQKNRFAKRLEFKLFKWQN
jgi:hypothetical protein